eukprot:6207483-Pleurochrysis_carterae.AAC.3
MADARTQRVLECDCDRAERVNVQESGGASVPASVSRGLWPPSWGSRRRRAAHTQRCGCAGRVDTAQSHAADGP